MTQYYNILKNLWQELDLFYEADQGNVECSMKTKKKKMIEKKSV